LSKSPTLNHAISDLERTLGQAISLHQRGRLDKAERLYQQILKRRSDHFDALHLLGVIRGQQGRNEEASRLVGRAVAVRPGSAEAHSNLGNILQALGRYDEAIASYDKSLAISRRNPEALNNRGNALQRLDRHAEAVACYDAAVAIHPTFADAFYNRGNALKNLNRRQEALASYDKAIAIRPSYPDAFYERGNVLQQLRRLHDALTSYDHALAVKPDYVEALHSRAFVLHELGRYDEALAEYDRVLAIRPSDADAWFNRAGVLEKLGRHEEAIASHRRALRIDPDHLHAKSELLRLLLYRCEWTEASQIASGLPSEIARGAGSLTMTLLYLPSTPAEHLACAQAYLRRLIPVLPKPLSSGRTQHGGRIRLAYLSADFRIHVVGTVIGELLERHDRQRFEVFGISIGPDDGSGLRRRLVSSFDRFFDARHESDESVARLLDRLEIDVAVDLMGHTEHCRPGILAHRPAPVQASYLGFPGTTGAEFIDYVLADRFVAPFDQQPFFTEKIVHLPDSYQPTDSKREIAGKIPKRTEIGLPEDQFVFCCFNSSSKLSPPVFDVWMRLLNSVEGSVLWLTVSDNPTRENLRREAERRGVEAGRLVLTDRVGHADYLARQVLADLFLDTLPYNAHGTGSNALAAGLPILTCRGETFAGRVGASLLHAVGLPELVTNSLEEYEALAFKLAIDRDLLRSVRRRLEANRATCALFDTDRLRRHVESAYETMWERYSRGEPPASFSVAPIPDASC